VQNGSGSLFRFKEKEDLMSKKPLFGRLYCELTLSAIL